MKYKKMIKRSIYSLFSLGFDLGKLYAKLTLWCSAYLIFTILTDLRFPFIVEICWFMGVTYLSLPGRTISFLRNFFKRYLLE